MGAVLDGCTLATGIALALSLFALTSRGERCNIDIKDTQTMIQEALVDLNEHGTIFHASIPKGGTNMQSPYTPTEMPMPMDKQPLISANPSCSRPWRCTGGVPLHGPVFPTLKI